MKTIRVVAAIIIEDGKVFATQRGYGEFKDGWEFPGGKIEAGEGPEAALRREIMEELETEVAVGRLLTTVEWDYPTFHLSMDCFVCSIVRRPSSSGTRGSPMAHSRFAPLCCLAARRRRTHPAHRR